MTEYTLPPCPITGENPSRHVQRVSAQFLKDLWRIEFGVDAAPSFGSTTLFNLWESPTGLFYFDPPLEGDAGFYKDFYGFLGRHGIYRPGSLHAAHRLTAPEIEAGQSVLDVGCGYGRLREIIPAAHYTGLDPHFAGENPWIRAQSLDEHLLSHASHYDAVCLFEVLEHLSDPATMMRGLARAAKPGGRVFISVPHRFSAMMRIPNYLMNAPPHHLTWWTPDALRAVAARAGLTVEKIEPTPWCQVSSPNYWIARCSPAHTKDFFFRHSWLWHASSVIGMSAGIVMNILKGPPDPTTDGGAGLFMIARRPTSDEAD